MHPTFRIIQLSFFIALASVSCNIDETRSESGEVFKSSAFTPEKSLTSGAEGPAVDKDGFLYAVNVERQGTIGRVTPTGEYAVLLELPGGSIGNGIRFNSQGTMLIADYVNHNVLQLAPGSKELQVLAHEPQMNQPNDLAIDGKNRLYASDPNWKESTGRLWRIDPDGKVSLLADSMGTTNGIEVSPDEKTLYVNESVQRKLWAFDLSEQGTISNKHLVMEFPDFGMDGMRCDADGNIYITRHGKGTVVKLAPDGTILREIPVSGKTPSNIAFGGKDGRTAFVTVQDKGNIEQFRVDVPGREWVMMHSKK